MCGFIEVGLALVGVEVQRQMGGETPGPESLPPYVYMYPPDKIKKTPPKHPPLSFKPKKIKTRSPTKTNKNKNTQKF